MKRIKPILPAIGIFCFALTVRIIYNNTVAYHYYPLHDSAFYQGIAFHLLKEHCFCLEAYVPNRRSSTSLAIYYCRSFSHFRS